MSKRVLDIGNCGPDHGAIGAMIRTNFRAEVEQADGAADALSLLKSNDFDLVLVNRILDRDGTSGMDVLAQVHESHSELPVMLITNFAEHQDAAIAAGGVRGFGKNAIGTTETIDLLSNYLA